MDVAHLIQNKIYKIHVITDSQYLADLYKDTFQARTPKCWYWESIDIEQYS